MSANPAHGADNKSAGRGRPPHRETAARVAERQSVLAYLRTRGQAISSVSGEALELRAIAYLVWFELQERTTLQQLGREARNELREKMGARPERFLPGEAFAWAIPPIGPRLKEERERAIRVVRNHLLRRARQHVWGAEAGKPVWALRMTRENSSGRQIVPAFGDARPGLPGLYSSDWPTTIGLEGEASMDLASEFVRRGGFEIVKLDVRGAQAVLRRMETEDPDDAAVAEEVASHCRRGSAERALRRLIREAEEYEYVHLGGGSTKLSLPPPRVS